MVEALLRDQRVCETVDFCHIKENKKEKEVMAEESGTDRHRLKEKEKEKMKSNRNMSWCSDTSNNN